MFYHGPSSNTALSGARGEQGHTLAAMARSLIQY